MGFRLAIDAAHGGAEFGVNQNGYIEKDLNLELSLLIKSELERCDVEVFLTRKDDTFIALSDRAQIAKDNACNGLISIHFGASDSFKKGTEIIYSVFKQCMASSKWIAECILAQTSKLGLSKSLNTRKSDVYKESNYHSILRNLEPMPGLIIEGLFLDNLDDVKFLEDANFLKKLAAAYAVGICTAYGVRYIQGELSQDQDKEKEVKAQESLPIKISNSFSDWDNILDSAKAAAKAMKDLGFIVGDATGNFNPNLPLTRQDFVIIMHKILNKYNLL